MANEPTIDLDLLLTPIAGDNPAGENLIYSGLHDQIREARRSEENLAQGDWERQIKVADWHAVTRLATEALSTKTKDLQVAAWLAEALVKLYGFAGMRDSFRLMNGLIANFWEHAYPEIEDGDLDARANALSFLDRQCAFAIKEAPITGSPMGRNLSYLQWEESKKFDIPENLEALSSADLERANAIKEQAAQEGKVTSEQWRIARNSGPRAFYEEVFALLRDCGDGYKALDGAMDEKFRSQTPGLGALRKSLEDVTFLVEGILKEKRLLEPDADPVREAGAATDAVSTPAMEPAAVIGGIVGPIRSRQDALKRLAQIAEFFRNTEPHSPVSYLVQRAIRWGEMPLDLWLEDVIKDGGVLGHLRETLGIKSASQS